MKPELKPCPFCGGANIELDHTHISGVCGDCCAEGPFGDADMAVAIESWNRRAQPAEPVNVPSAPAIAWLYEDELPPNYPYDAMFPYSKVDGVRMFPVFVPQPLPAPVGQVRWRNGEPIVWWKTNQIPEAGTLLYTTIPPVTE